MYQNKETNRNLIKGVLADTLIQSILAVIGGIILVLLAYILGTFLFGPNPLLYKGLFLIVPVTIGVSVAFDTLLRHIKLYRRHRKYMGEGIVEITPDVERSADGARQSRMTKGDGPEHYHAEILDPSSLVVLESSLCGEVKAEPLGIGTNRWVSIIDDAIVDPVVFHYLGCPPELAGSSKADKRILLPRPKILLIRQISGDEIAFRPNDDILLFRFTETGEYAGDTWHQSIEEAKAQAEFEYGIAGDAWHTVPDGVEDVVRFALNL